MVRVVSWQSERRCGRSMNRQDRDRGAETSGYATWFTAGGAIRIGHYDVIDDVITQKL